MERLGASVPGTADAPEGADAPWKLSFVGLLRRLAAQDHRDLGAPPVGAAERPGQEGFRLGQHASLAFAPREVANVQARAGKLHVKLLGLGMLGPNGPLPLHMTEWARERSESRRDETLADFLDLFHHRYLTHLYRAWAQSQAAAGLDRAEEELFSRYVARLAGDEPAEVQASALAPHARWASAAHRVRASRDPDGLVSTLRRYFGVPVRLREFELHWITLEPQDFTRLGQARASAILGLGAVAGEVVPDRQSRFRLLIGPLDLPGYLRLTPEGQDRSGDLHALVELVRSFIGFEYEWEVELLIHGQAAPASRLGDSGQLGWSTWMGDAVDAPQVITGMVFEPERYIGHLPPRVHSHRGP